MSNLPVIVGFGGVNAAGRSSFHHGFRRLIINKLSAEEKEKTFMGLSTMMGILRFQEGKLLDAQDQICQPHEIEGRYGQQIINNTLLRKIAPALFDVEKVPIQTKISVESLENGKIEFQLSQKNLPRYLPENWVIKEISGSENVTVTIKGSLELQLADHKESLVKTAGQLPSGFNPGDLYHSKHHPRGIQMSLFAASDAINSLGIDWQTVKQAVHPDQIGVYGGSGHGQMDETAGGGLMNALLTGKRTTSRHLPLSLVDMPSNFINAYVVGNMGHTGTQIAACATFLYNLELAIKEIQSGRRRVAIVGNSEAPILPEIMEGYKAMGALAEDSRLLNFSSTGTIEHLDRARSCKPFGENCGFTLSESAQFVVLFDDALAVELGAQIHGAVADIFIKADGFKKSISAPGFGNYITLAKAAARLRAILGEKALRERSFVSAHGSGTPLNRTTESHGLNETAKAFQIKQWQISAIKCYLGHPLTPASGDQLMAALGTWKHGIIPGIFTLDAVPDDVHRSNLAFSQEHLPIEQGALDAVFINSKGFGGNNATGLVLSPQVTLRMLRQKHGQQALKNYQSKNEAIVENADDYDRRATLGEFQVYYKDNEKVLKEEDLNLSDQELRIPGYEKPVNLNLENPFPEMKLND